MACANAVENAARKVKGVRNVDINLFKGIMFVTHDGNRPISDDITDAIKNAGYSAAASSLEGQEDSIGNEEKEVSDLKQRVYACSILLLPLLYLSLGDVFTLPLPAFISPFSSPRVFSLLQFFLCLPIIWWSRHYFVNGLRRILKGSPNMDSLVAIACASAIFYGIYIVLQIHLSSSSADAAKYTSELYFDSAAVILTIITLGRFIEARVKIGTMDSFSKLVSLAPKTAVVEVDGEEREILAENVQKDDIVVIRAGAYLPVDGIVVSGYGVLDESLVTGESLPATKTEGQRVISASVNKDGFFKYRATRVGQDTTISQVIHLVEEASSTKAPIGRMADKISRFFVPSVIIIAALTFVTWLIMGKGMNYAIYSAVAVLIISCPCTLGLATPAAIMTAIDKSAKMGVMIKSAEYLEAAGRVDTVVLDKTGTITEGKYEVLDIITAESISQGSLLEVAVSIENLSSHPFAQTIMEYAKKEKLDPLPIEDFKTVPGKGVEGRLHNQQILAGNLKMMRERKIDLQGFDEEFFVQEEGKSIVYFVRNNFLLGIISLADKIKSSSALAIMAMHDMGINTIMLSGDNKAITSAVQKQVGIKEALAEVLPQDKEREIRHLQRDGHIVCMIGDGINDAPALARADLSISISSGSDIATETANIILMKDDLIYAANILELGRATLKNIKQNLFWAFIYNTIGIPVAAGLFYGVLSWKLSPTFAAAAMSLSSISVLFNSLQLKSFRPKNIF